MTFHNFCRQVAKSHFLKINFFRERLRDELTGIAEFILVSTEWVVCLSLNGVKRS